MARFRAAAFVGDYETVYLNEVRRTVENDQVASDFTRLVIPSFRYGKATMLQLDWLRANTATVQDTEADPAWKSAVTLHGHHWYSELSARRATVESDNARALVSFASEHNEPVMAVNAQHLPAKKARKLQRLSAKMFRGVSAAFFACNRLPLMLLENVAPSVGLFNGALVEFVGPLFLGDDLHVRISRRDYASKVHVRGVTLTEPIDTPHSEREQVHQVPSGSVIVRVNGEDVAGDERRLAQLVAATSDATVRLVLRTPKQVPHLPEFMVVRVPSYAAHGGKNLLDLEGEDDLVPIRAVKRGRTGRRAGRVIAEDDNTEFRVGFPLEGGSAFTSFKGQGATLDRVVAKVKEWVGVPGFWTVVVSRVKHPKHLHIPEGQMPSVQEICAQRLNNDVIEAEIFERQMRISAAGTCRRVMPAADGDEWTDRQNLIADAIMKAWERRLRRLSNVAIHVANTLSALEPPVEAAEVHRVRQRMLATDEKLMLGEPIYLKQADHRRMLRQTKRRRGSSSGAARPKRPASTSADRGGRGAKRGRVTGRGDGPRQ